MYSQLKIVHRMTVLPNSRYRVLGMQSVSNSHGWWAVGKNHHEETLQTVLGSCISGDPRLLLPPSQSSPPHYRWKSCTILHNYHSLSWIIPLCHNILNNTLSPSPRLCGSWQLFCSNPTLPPRPSPVPALSSYKNDRLWPFCGKGSLLGRGFLYSNNCSRSCVIQCPEWYCQKSRPAHQGHPNTC